MNINPSIFLLLLLLLFLRKHAQPISPSMFSVLSLSVVPLICLSSSLLPSPSHPGMFVHLVPGQFQVHSDTQSDMWDLCTPPHHRYHRNLQKWGNVITNKKRDKQHHSSISDVLTHGHSKHGSRLRVGADGTQSSLLCRLSHPQMRSTGSSYH